MNIMNTINTNQSDLFEKVKEVVARTFKVSPEVVSAQGSLGQLPGWDSLGHLILMMEIEKEFSVHFPIEKINQPTSTLEICELLRETQAG
jgi:acyl carrier protein